MKSFLYGLAVLPFVAGVALAGQPMELSNQQMDKVTAGFSIHEVDESNTSWVGITAYVFPVGEVGCPNGCYLSIVSDAIQVGAQFGPAR